MFLDLRSFPAIGGCNRWDRGLVTSNLLDDDLRTSSQSFIDEAFFTTQITVSSIANGNWSSPATWENGYIPDTTDIVTIAHNVTMDSSRGVGARLASGNVGLTINTGKTLTIDVGQLTISCDVLTKGTGLIQQSAGAGVEFDATLAFDPANTKYQVSLGDGHNNNARWIINGSSGSRCYVRSNAGGGNAWINDGSGPWLQSGLVQATYCDFIRIGDASNPAIRTSPTGGTDFLLQNCVLDTCGKIASTYNLAADSDYRLENVTFKNTLATECVTMASSIAKTTGIRTILDSVFDKTLNLYAVAGWNIQRSIFLKGFDTTHNGQNWTTFSNNFYQFTAGNGNDVNIGGDVSDCFWLSNDNDYNPHFIDAGNYAGFNQTISGVIFEAANGNTTPAEEGDCILLKTPSSATTVTIQNCIVLPNAAGKTTGTLFSALGNANITIIANHNTCHSGTQGAAVGETYAGYAGMLSSFKSNIFWNITGGQGYKLYDSGSNDTVSDLVTSANANYNCGYNLLAGSNLKGYHNQEFSSGSPGANDVDINPNFVDSTRDLASWGASLGGTGTDAQKRAYAIAALSGVNEPGWNSSATVANLIAYIRAGFAPQEATLKNAAHDGGDIGAVAVVSAGIALAAAVADVSSVTAALSVAIPLSAAIADASTVTASLANAVSLAGAVVDTSAVAAAVSLALPLSTSVVDASSVTASLSVSKGLQAAVDSASSVAASMAVAKSLVASVADDSSITAALDVTGGGAVALAASVVDASTVTANAAASYAVNAASASVSAVTATLSVAKSLQASIADDTSTFASLAMAQALSGAVASASTVTANLSAAKSLAASVADGSSVTATLGLIQVLTASVASVSTVSANLAKAAGLAASVVDASTVTAAAAIARGLNALVDSGSQIIATLRQLHALQSAINSGSVITADLSVLSGITAAYDSLKASKRKYSAIASARTYSTKAARRKFNQLLN